MGILSNHYSNIYTTNLYTILGCSIKRLIDQYFKLQ